MSLMYLLSSVKRYMKYVKIRSDLFLFLFEFGKSKYTHSISKPEVEYDSLFKVPPFPKLTLDSNTSNPQREGYRC